MQRKEKLRLLYRSHKRDRSSVCDDGRHTPMNRTGERHAIVRRESGSAGRGRSARKRGQTALLLAWLKVYIPPIFSRGFACYDSQPVAVAFIALFATLSVGSASAQDRRVPSSAAELRLSYAPIVQRVQPAVVNVYAAKTVQNRNPLLDDPIFRRFFGVPGQQPRADAALAGLGRDGRSRPASSSPTTTSSRAPTRSRSRSPTSASSRPRSCSRTAAPIWRCCG